jgi:Leucine-rich repeat (LRR) protein
MLLSEVIKKSQLDKRQAAFVTEDKVSFNYLKISFLDTSKKSINFSKIKKLFLSHNSLQSLHGLEAFKSLTHLSLAFNHLKSIE